MKKLIVLFITLTTVFAFTAQAQQANTVAIGDGSGPVNTNVNVPINVTFTDIGAFDFYIDYNSANATFVGTANPMAGVTVNHSIIGGRIYVNAFVPGGITTAPQNLKLVDLVFTSTTVGASDLDFYFVGNYGDAGTTFIGEDSATPVAATFTDGSVEFTAVVAPVPVKNWAIFIGLGLIIAFAVVRFRRLV